MTTLPAVLMIVLHSATGTEIDINARAITNLRNPEKSNPAFTAGVRCMINMTDGKFVTVTETCLEVRKLIEGRPQ